MSVAAAVSALEHVNYRLSMQLEESAVKMDALQQKLK